MIILFSLMSLKRTRGVRDAAAAARAQLVPNKSRKVYDRHYFLFKQFLSEHETEEICEDSVLAYMSQVLDNYAASTAWTIYSALKRTILVNDNQDIGVYKTVPLLLKNHAQAHKKKKAPTFTTEEVDTFLRDSPTDFAGLQDKLALILGLYGGLRSEEHTILAFGHVQIQSNEKQVKVTVPARKTDQAGNGTTFFALANSELYKCPVTIFRQYATLLDHPGSDFPLFPQFRHGSVTKQKHGKTFFYELPRRVANFLALPNPKQYTGHSIRRTATTWLALNGMTAQGLQVFGGWKSASIAQEYVESSDTFKLSIAKHMMSEHSENAPTSSSVTPAGTLSPPECSRDLSPFQNCQVTYYQNCTITYAGTAPPS